jgi:hypothetical protein
VFEATVPWKARSVNSLGHDAMEISVVKSLEPRCSLELRAYGSHGAQGHGAMESLECEFIGARCHGDFSCEIVGAMVLGATVVARASCSWKSAEVCVTLGHEVGRRRQQRRELSVLYTNL